MCNIMQARMPCGSPRPTRSSEGATPIYAFDNPVPRVSKALTRLGLKDGATCSKVPATLRDHAVRGARARHTCKAPEEGFRRDYRRLTVTLSAESCATRSGYRDTGGIATDYQNVRNWSHTSSRWAMAATGRGSL
jgi:hypothetical protein